MPAFSSAEVGAIESIAPVSTRNDALYATGNSLFGWFGALTMTGTCISPILTSHWQATCLIHSHIIVKQFIDRLPASQNLRRFRATDAIIRATVASLSRRSRTSRSGASPKRSVGGMDG